jgi:hypothetical protein
MVFESANALHSIVQLIHASKTDMLLGAGLESVFQLLFVVWIQNTPSPQPLFCDP